MAITRHRRREAPSLEPVAGNGLLDRRALLRGGVALAGAVGGIGLTSAGAEPLSEPAWTRGPGITTGALNLPSKFEDKVTRVVSNPNAEPRTQHARTPHHMLNGTITPNSLHFTINHEGIPEIDPAQHRLVIHGMVRQPLIFTMDKLARYPMVSRRHFVECGGNSAPMFSNEPVQASLQFLHGLCSTSEWTGVLLSTLLDEAGVDPKASWVIAEGADAEKLSRSVPLKKCMDDAMICVYQNGEHLMPGNGYPIRLLLPGYEGNMNVKFLRRLMVTNQPAMTYYEERNYSPILPTGKAYRFYFVNEVKSFITHPSFGQALSDKGYYEISGIAYSGTGRIAKVMVSADGGKSWAEAALQDPVPVKGFTRFRIPWRWDGQPVTLTSRAWDESGNVQPLRQEFVALRGQTQKPVTNPQGFPNQHYNSLTSWGINAKGEIAHVYV